MRWATLALPLMAIIALIPGNIDGASAKASLDGDEFWVSVDPSDPDQGVLVITGEVRPTITEVLEKLTVTLDSNITEMGPDGKTGNYWHSMASFDGAAASPTKVFKKGDGPASFTVEMDPTRTDPQTTRDIPVPAGISLLTWGKLVLTATYSGAAEGSSRSEARIYPEPFYLVNLSMSTRGQNISAGGILNFTFNVKNPSNQEEGVAIDMPLIPDLLEIGWNVSVTMGDITSLEPGEAMDVNVRIVAPDEIPYDDTLSFEVTARTIEADPDTLEPFSTSLSAFDLHMIRSKTDGGGGGGGGSEDGGQSGPSSGEIAAGLAVLGLVGTSLVILLFALLRGKGGGRDGARAEDHSAPVRM